MIRHMKSYFKRKVKHIIVGMVYQVNQLQDRGQEIVG